MKNNTNIYDIDGNLIRSAGDNHQMTVEEAQKRVDYYKELIQNDESKKGIYDTYIKNLNTYIFNLYSKMTPDQLKQLLSEKSTEEQVNEAINELRKELDDTETGENTPNEVSGPIAEYREDSTDTKSGNVEIVEREFSDVYEERPVSQSDLLVERGDMTNNMDEYVDFEEIPA